MNDYMIQKADDQIEAGLNERESLLQQLAKLKDENEKLKKMIDLGLGWEDLKREI